MYQFRGWASGLPYIFRLLCSIFLGSAYGIFSDIIAILLTPGNFSPVLNDIEPIASKPAPFLSYIYAP